MAPSSSCAPGKAPGKRTKVEVRGLLRGGAKSIAVQRRPAYEESAQGARSCDLEGNRAGLGCLEHLRNALSFAVVTEWPVGVYPHVAVDGTHLMPV